MPTSKKTVMSGVVSESRVNELIRNYGIWVQEESFTSLAQQDAAEDVLTPIDFGESKTSPNGLISYDDTLKSFTSIKGGPFMAKTRCRARRIGGSAGESELFLQAQISTDNVNWVNTGNPVDIALVDSKVIELFFDFSPVEFTAGLKFRQVFTRSSTGTDFGSFVSGIPSVPLQNLGIGTSPAAQFSVYRLKDYNYV